MLRYVRISGTKNHPASAVFQILETLLFSLKPFLKPEKTTLGIRVHVYPTTKCLTLYGCKHIYYLPDCQASCSKSIGILNIDISGIRDHGMFEVISHMVWTFLKRFYERTSYFSRSFVILLGFRNGFCVSDHC